MQTEEELRNKFHKILLQSSYAREAETQQQMTEFAMHLIHDELNTEERLFVEDGKFYNWLFPLFWTEEERQVIESFRRMVLGRKTVLYGRGPVTKLLLNCGFGRKVFGVMPGSPGTVFCGKPVMDETMLAKEAVTQVIVTARVCNYRVIADRVRNFCMDNGILLKGLNGWNLVQRYDGQRLSWEDRRYLEKNEEELRQKIDKYDVVSFDIFDTLIMRKTMYPADVFQIVEKNAKSKGMPSHLFAEKRVWADRHNRYQGNIYGIYRTLQEEMMISDKARDELMKLELETERSLQVQRKEMVDAFRYAVLKGKKVFLISDMYLPKQLLGIFLQDLGIGGYEDIFVSCDYCCTKGGGLFHIYKESVGGDGAFLHIGDNVGADGEAPMKEGIDVFLIKSAICLLEVSNLKGIYHTAKAFEERNALGLLLAKLFQNPFGLKRGYGIIQVSTWKEWGYCFLGLYVVAFFQWLLQQMDRNKIDKMLFPSRDGYIFYRLYQWYKQEIDDAIPEAIYFITSRKLCYRASCVSEEDIDFLLKRNPDYQEELLQELCLVDKDEPIADNNDLGNESVMRYKDIIFQKSSVLRNRYLAYMEGLGLHQGTKYGLFDSYCNGTVQHLLERVTEFDFCGLYLGKISNALLQKNVYSFYEDKGKYLIDNDINDKGHLMEFCFSSPQPSVDGMDSTGNFVYAEEKRSYLEQKAMAEIQEGIFSYFKEYYRNFPKSSGRIGSEVPNLLVNGVDTSEYMGECCGIWNLRNPDDMGKGSFAVFNKTLV